MKDITVEEVKLKLDNQEKFVFIDVREPFEYEADNLGAQLVPLGQFPQFLEDYDGNIADEVVIHCRSGARSGAAKQIMAAQGYSNVRNMLGGILEWREKIG